MPRARTKRNRHRVAVRDGDARYFEGELIPAAIEVQTVTHFTGPIPPPEILSGYDHVVPGLANRIAVLAEGEAEHRRALQRRHMRFAEAGLASSFVIAMTVICGGHGERNGSPWPPCAL